MGKKKVTYDKNEKVEFKMMFRNHNDPLYYDTNAATKIFVPQINPDELTEEKQKIIDSFPAEDRGEILDIAEYEKKGYGLGQEQLGFAPGAGG